MSKLLCIFALILSLFVCVPAASASWSQGQIESLALHDAQLYWHVGVPCKGDVRFEASPPPKLSSEQEKEIESNLASISMWATFDDWGTYSFHGEDEPFYFDWKNFEGPEFNSAAFSNCVIHINSEFWTSAHEMIARWPSFSQSVAHEVEHLENFWWSETPIDGGKVPLSAVSVYDVNYPIWTCHNEPLSAQHHHPPGAPSQRAAALFTECVNTGGNL